MTTVDNVKDRTDLCGILNNAELFGASDLYEEEIKIDHYAMDHRTGWDTWLVSAKGRILGMTDGPLS